MSDKSAATSGVPGQYARIIEEKIDDLVKRVGNLDGWAFLFEKQGMMARKLDGEKMQVRADAEIPFSLLEVFDLIINGDTLPLINPQVDKMRRHKTFNYNTFTQNVLFKKVWPTAARDMCNMTHWRVLEDGRIAVISFNCEEYHAKDAYAKPESGVVRADLTIGGYIIEQTKEGGTKITYLVCSDLRGSIPTSVSNTVLRGQPLIVTSIARELRKAGKSKALKQFERDEICSMAMILAKKYLLVPDGGKKSTRGRAKSSSQQKGAGGSSGESGDSGGEAEDGGPIISPRALFPLLLPLLIHFLCENHYWTMVSIVAIMPYCYKKLIIDPLTVGSIEHELFEETPPGRLIIRLAPELENMLKYVGERRKEEDGVEFSLTHVVVKAIARALHETPTLNGYMIGNRFYKARKSENIELSVSTGSSDMAAIHVKDAHRKGLRSIADELLSASKLIRNGTREKSKSQVLLDAVPPPIMFIVVSALRFFGLYQALCSSSADAGGKPVCHVLSIPRSDYRSRFDGDFVFIPQQSSLFLSDAPTSITIGDVTMKTTTIPPAIATEELRVKQMPVLNLSISINSNAVSLTQAKHFSITLQRYLNDPNLL